MACILFLHLCCEVPWFTSIQRAGCDREEHHSYLGTERNTFVVEVFDDSDKVGADVLLHGCPQSCMPNPVKGLFKVYEDMVEVLLLLEIFLTEDS